MRINVAGQVIDQKVLEGIKFVGDKAENAQENIKEWYGRKSDEARINKQKRVDAREARRTERADAKNAKIRGEQEKRSKLEAIQAAMGQAEIDRNGAIAEANSAYAARVEQLRAERAAI